MREGLQDRAEGEVRGKVHMSKWKSKRNFTVCGTYPSSTVAAGGECAGSQEVAIPEMGLVSATVAPPEDIVGERDTAPPPRLCISVHPKGDEVICFDALL